MATTSYKLSATSLLAWVGCLFALALFQPAHAAIEFYDFSSEELRQRYQQVGGQLRCPMCENQAIIDSDSPSAFDMRQELYRLLEAGYSDQDIMAFMQARFGDFILYRPPVRSDTWLLWFFPPVLVVLGLLFILMLVRHNQRTDSAQGKADPQPIDAEAERQLRLQKILDLDRH